MEKKLVPEVAKTITDVEPGFKFLQAIYFHLSNRSYRKVKLSDFLVEMESELNRILEGFRDKEKLDPNTEISCRESYWSDTLDIITYRLETEEEAIKRKQKAEKEKIRRAKAKETALRNKVEQYKKLEKELKLVGKI